MFDTVVPVIQSETQHTGALEGKQCVLRANSDICTLSAKLRPKQVNIFRRKKSPMFVREMRRVVADPFGLFITYLLRYLLSAVKKYHSI